MNRYFRSLFRLSRAILDDPRGFARVVNTVPSVCDATRFSRTYTDTGGSQGGVSPSSSPNPLWDYFQTHSDGRGIWKWEHYFDIYHRHFSRFVGQKVSVMEIGIYSGGSLEMWRSYFGEQSHVYGVDVEPACSVYEGDRISVLIGDQADRDFWRTVKTSVADIDIVIDDGGHTPEQQQITLEELLPHLRPGGVYVCEDVHGVSNRFCGFATGLVNELNRTHFESGPLLRSSVSQLQASIHSIHFYPYVVAIEKRSTAVTELSAPKHGTDWQPFL
jgi:hypothetical protein